MSSLQQYRAKRRFDITSEPAGTDATQPRNALTYVVHKHDARRLHYDLRLEHEGVLWSWAVTRGPSLNPEDKRLAVQVEDHPLDYASFEGVIPRGQYGAGPVIVWDRGTWAPEVDPAHGMAKGHLAFSLAGEKLKGRWNLVRLRARGGDKRANWLLIKAYDAEADADRDILVDAPRSVASGHTIEEVEAGLTPVTIPARTLRSTAAVARPRGRDVEFPGFVSPSLASLGDRPPEGDDWLHEVKFDGYRVQAQVRDRIARLLTRTGLDWTARFPSAIRGAFAALPCEDAVIDGEIVAFDRSGAISFGALQGLMSDGEHAPSACYAFDLLMLDGEDLRGQPLLTRKERLQDLLGAHVDDAILKFSEHFTQSGGTMLRHACRMGLEGVVSKRAEAPYRSGRTRDWIKSKCRQRQEFVIVGYTHAKTSARDLGALLVGFFDQDELVLAGRVGTGFTRNTADRLKKALDMRHSETSPLATRGRPASVVWVKPELVAEVEFAGWTGDRLLRQAVFRGLRDDKPAAEVTAETSTSEKAREESSRASHAVHSSIRLSNPDKLLWPQDGVSKRMLLEYYSRVWPLMQPHIVNRPLSLLRAPDGVGSSTFFQKHAGPGMDAAVHRRRDIDGKDLLYIRDFDGLAALVQLGVVELHIWGATIDAIETPDTLTFDLDPDPTVKPEIVQDAARELRSRLGDMSLESHLKASGGKGYHVVVPLKPGADWHRVKEFARDSARAMEASDPKLYTATLSRKARHRRIFIDYLRNGRGSTAIAPYSTRARPGTPLAVPIQWDRLDRNMRPDLFRLTEVVTSGLREAGIEEAPWPRSTPVKLITNR
jgi:bifunctional non-homologous end joining protein LigD